jgi:hypothetical protein
MGCIVTIGKCYRLENGKLALGIRNTLTNSEALLVYDWFDGQFCVVRANLAHERAYAFSKEQFFSQAISEAKASAAYAGGD